MSLEIIKKYNIKAKKSLGQNFLVNNEIIKNIANSIDIQGKNVIEVGPGYGVITEELLLSNPKSLTLLELDDNMVDILNMRVKAGDLQIGNTNFKIEKIDVLNYVVDLKDYCIIANIPYYITSPILKHFLYEVKNIPQEMVILMQKDVGEKILGKGKNKSSVLSLFIDKKCYVSELFEVKKENFMPSPKVKSSVLLFEKHNSYNDIDDNKFLELIKNGFREPRKKLIKNLLNSGYEKNKLILVFKELQIDENKRGEDLNIEIWCKLCRLLK